jgi:hypothetical protein
MKIFKGLLTVLLLTCFLFPLNNSYADGKYYGTLSSLNKQLYQEVNNIMQLPAFLTFSGKDLKGEAMLKMTVKENGKIDLIEITGNNRNLNLLIKKKMETLNLWTDTKYSGNIFTYEIRMI